MQYTSWKASSDKMQCNTSQKRRREQWLNGSTQIIEAQLVYCISTPVPEVSTPIQYTTAQDMFGCRDGRFSTQPQLTYSYSGVL